MRRCGYCLRLDPALTCPRCAAHQTLSFQLDLLTAHTARLVASEAVEPYIGLTASAKLSGERIKMNELNDALSDSRVAVTRLKIKSATFKRDMQTSTVALTQSSTALRNAHTRQLTKFKQSRDSAYLQLQTVQKKLREQRAVVLRDLLTLMRVTPPPRFSIRNCEVPVLGDISSFSHRSLAAALHNLCLLITLLARYLNADLPYTLTFAPLAISKRSAVRKLTVSARLESLLKRSHSHTELDHFVEGLALLVCNIAYLCGIQDDCVEDTNAWLDVGKLLWRRLHSSSECNGVILDPTVVLVALRKHNKMDSHRKAWAEWQFVESEGNIQSDDVVFVEDQAEFDEPWTDIRRRPKKVS
ncbi:UV radiation resistance protein and autophagy-related subunit 14-domain-containing protein [Lipomyces arxii]|uniref:UV radiation resistance protein and autophagy-related subunit 14-domain-containing protein n=1 Tax=Lipomyces arxii TaxID=56418 RepID=UPI0034CFD182